MRFLKPVITLLILLVAQTLTAEEKNRPNILLIMTDDQGYGDLGIHGNEMIETPNLDAFAQQSFNFNNFHVCATCTETRAALMTGQYPMRSGVWHTIMGRSLLSPKVETLPQLLQAEGYRTGIFGKWHLGDNTPLRPFERGFDVSLTHGGGGVTQLPDVWGNDYFDDVYFRNGIPEQQSGYCTDVFFKAARKFIDSRKQTLDDGQLKPSSSKQPWFCYLATNAPHGPYNVPKHLKQHYLDKGVKGNMAAFYGMITNIDDNFGRLFEHLEKSGELENTVVIFMTDNGTAAGVNWKAKGSGNGWAGFNAGMRGTKGSQFDGGHRVPFIIRLPSTLGGSSANKPINRLAAHIDVMPTIADLCDVAISPNLDGRSLVPLLKNSLLENDQLKEGQLDWPDRTLFVQIQRMENPKKWHKCSVMTEQYRLIDGDQLFDIVDDPGQKENIASRYPTVVKDLREKYEKWWSRISRDVLQQHVYIKLGTPAEKNSRLTAHDWHGAPVWSQTLAKKNPKSEGEWRVEFATAGRYKFECRLRPHGVDEPLNASAVELKVQFNDGTVIKKQVRILADANVVEVDEEIPEGEGTLRVTLLDETLEPMRGCYFVYVTIVGSD